MTKASPPLPGSEPDEPAVLPTRQRSVWGLLAQPPFALFLSGMLLSSSASFCRALVQALLIYRMTGSTFMVGVVSFAHFAGVIFLAPVTGAIADRYSRRGVLFATQAGQAVLSLVLALLVAGGHASTWTIVGLAGVIGCGYAFASPAQRALMPALVDRADLHRAISLDSAAVNLSKAAGPLLGTVLVVTVGFAWGFAVTALFHVAFMVILVALGPRPQQLASRRPKLRDGLSALREKPLLIALLVIVAAAGAGSDPAPTLGPAFATEVFGRSDTLAGFIFGTFGIGAVLGAFTLARPAARPYMRMAVHMAIMAAATAVFALSGVLWVSLGAIGLAGFSYLVCHTQASALLYAHVPEAQRGRVMALWTLAFVGTRPLTSLVSGSIADTVGVQVAALVTTVPVLATAALTLALHFRDRAGRLPAEVDPAPRPIPRTSRAAKVAKSA